jgi:hypothetical protein
VSERVYYSQRMGRGPRGNPSIGDLVRSLKRAVDEMTQRDYFQEWYGYYCVDAGDVPGRAGVGLSGHMETVLGFEWPLPEDPLGEWPDDQMLPIEVVEKAEEELQDHVFDAMEFLHDHVSAGIADPSSYHTYNQCGWHYQNFDREPAQELFRSRVNGILSNYKTGYRLTPLGEIERRAPDGMNQLLGAKLLTSDQDLKARVDTALAINRSRHRTVDDQRDAVRNLFDVLEKLRPLVNSEMMTADERDLFNIANNFTIRHFNDRQRGEYDSALWLSWMFYVNLATVHLLARISDR